MRVWSLIIASCLVTLYPQSAQSQIVQEQISKLKSIVPAESTAADVGRLFGEPLNRSPDFYKMKDYNLLISYASGLPCEHPCYERGRDVWKVPRDTVITFVVIIKVDFHQRDLVKLFGIDLSKYKESPPDHIGAISYSNDEDGIRIDLNGDQVSSIALYPAKKYLPLMCSLDNERPLCPTGAGNH